MKSEGLDCDTTLDDSYSSNPQEILSADTEPTEICPSDGPNALNSLLNEFHGSFGTRDMELDDQPAATNSAVLPIAQQSKPGEDHRPN
jgi:hypothetical protein